MASNDFFGWLATQPTFVEVTAGACFCLFVAPVVMAAMAIVVTALETLMEKHLTLLLSRVPQIIPRAFLPNGRTQN